MLRVVIMRAPVLLSLVFLFAGSLTVVRAQSGQNNYAAAACCARGPKCWPQHAKESQYCRTGQWMSGQSKNCQRAACRYCNKSKARRQRPVCRAIPILRNCFNRRPPFPRPPPLPSRKPNNPKPSSPRPGRRGCSFRAVGGKVVIPAMQLPAPGQWKRTNGNTAITWKPSSGGGIDRPENGAPFCIRFTPDRSGTHYFTVLSSAPHPTEHNDAWFRFPMGVTLYRPETGSVRNGGTSWHKGYENLGQNIVANYIVTIDFNGHQFITKPLTKGKTYSVCISGRSTKFSIYKVVLVNCSSLSGCSRYGGFIKSAMANLPSSKCY